MKSEELNKILLQEIKNIASSVDKLYSLKGKKDIQFNSYLTHLVIAQDGLIAYLTQQENFFQEVIFKINRDIIEMNNFSLPLTEGESEEVELHLKKIEEIKNRAINRN